MELKNQTSKAIYERVKKEGKFKIYALSIAMQKAEFTVRAAVERLIAGGYFVWVSNLEFDLKPGIDEACKKFLKDAGCTTWGQADLKYRLLVTKDTSVQIMQALESRDLKTGELSELIGVKPPNISGILSQLKQVGFITKDKTVNSMNKKEVRRFMSALKTFNEFLNK